jgi:hypothetical protein
MECVNLGILVETLKLNWIWTLVQAWTFRLTDKGFQNTQFEKGISGLSLLATHRRKNSKHPSVFFFNLLMLALFFLFTLSCTSSPKYLVEHLLIQILVLKREEDGRPNYK